MFEREIPRPQYDIFGINLSFDGEVSSGFLRRILKEIPIDSVHTVLDLYCGNGRLTLGSIILYTHAQIHAVDYHNVLVHDAIHHPRVTFHQGWVTEVLKSDDIPKADIVLMSYASRHHGFTEENISLLASHVKGVLFTVGDNDDIEHERWFQNHFVCKKSIPGHFAAVWEAR